jgi:hypothetical protein
MLHSNFNSKDAQMYEDRVIALKGIEENTVYRPAVNRLNTSSTGSYDTTLSSTASYHVRPLFCFYVVWVEIEACYWTR